MLTEFIDQALGRAKYKLLKDGQYFGEISNLRGVWASAKTLERCRHELQEVLEDWLLFKLRDGDIIPGMPLKQDHRHQTLQHA